MLSTLMPKYSLPRRLVHYMHNMNQFSCHIYSLKQTIVCKECEIPQS